MSLVRRRLWLLAQVALVAGMLAAVARHFAHLLAYEAWSAESVTLDPAFALAAAGCYLAAHTLFGTFFWQLMTRGPVPAPWPVAVRAYFVSQAGKYAPGKAWVILIRILMLKPHGHHPAHVGVAGTFETLVTMATGAAIGVALLPYSGWSLAAGSPGWLGFVALVLLPVAFGLAGGTLKRRFQTRLARLDAVTLPGARLLAIGAAQATLAWLLLGLSALATVRALTPDDSLAAALDLRGVLAGVCLSYVAGFAAVFVPGGLGARELLLQMMLQSQFQAAHHPEAGPLSVLVAVALRLIWTAAELTLGLTLYLVARPDVPTAAGGP